MYLFMYLINIKKKNLTYSRHLLKLDRNSAFVKDIVGQSPIFVVCIERFVQEILPAKFRLIRPLREHALINCLHQWRRTYIWMKDEDRST